jgi:hypothetical protein
MGFTIPVQFRNQKIFFSAALMALSIFLFTIPSAHSSSPLQSNIKNTNLENIDSSMQTMVMNLADEYIAYLGESVYLLIRNDELDPKGRWLAQSFLRNGVGACLDIAVGPNPLLNMLDLLVLTSLQTWAFKSHWIPAGIGKAGASAHERLKHAETAIWTAAKKNLSEAQMTTLRELIEAWISENSDRTVVSLVRFSDFTDKRRISSLAIRNKAHGLFKEIKKIRTTVDDALLLGERLMWFAGRYPYLIGEQTELTAYRLIDQPEGAQILQAIKSIQQLSDTMTKRIQSMEEDLEKQQTEFFSNFSVERTEAINRFFNRVSLERKAFLDDISSRDKELSGIMTELKQTISVSVTLAKELTETVNAVNRVVSHFDTDPNSTREPIKISDIRDAAIETGHAAEQTTLMLERAIKLLDSEYWDQRMSKIAQPMNEVVNRAFWLGVILIFLLIVGLFLLRLTALRYTHNGQGGNH